jgi:hypothetical protein
MKLLARSRSNPRQLFVPINRFVFDAFVVRVQWLEYRQSRTPRSVFQISQRLSQSNSAKSSIPVERHAQIGSLPPHSPKEGFSSAPQVG